MFNKCCQGKQKGLPASSLPPFFTTIRNSGPNLHSKQVLPSSPSELLLLAKYKLIMSGEVILQGLRKTNRVIGTPINIVQVYVHYWKP